VEFVWDTGERSCFFCDMIGFQPVGFHSFLVGTEYDFSQRLDLIKSDRRACETLADEIISQIHSDDHAPNQTGRDVIQAYIDRDPEGILLALSGWELESLIKLAFNEEF
jgi:hypothetical protein